MWYPRPRRLQLCLRGEDYALLAFVDERWEVGGEVLGKQWKSPDCSVVPQLALRVIMRRILQELKNERRRGRGGGAGGAALR